MLQHATDTGPSRRVIAGLLRLRWYQEEAVDGFFQLIDEDVSRRPVLVLPTGAGKSVVCAEIARRFHARTGKRVIVVIHTKELVAQNYAAFRKAAPDISAGLFSASLGRKDRRCTVTFANIQSIASHAESFHGVGLVLIDECHRMPHKAEGQYHQLIEGLSRANNEPVACGGMTATPYRMSSGNLLEPYKGEPAFFSDIAYELDILTLQEEGWLCQMVPEPTNARISIKTNSKTVSKLTGDYTPAALEEAANNDPLNVAIAREIIAKCADRQSWLVFCVSIDHAQRMTALLRSAGVQVACVTGQTKQAERDRLIEQFKAGSLRCLVNVDVLTTGFDAPGTDALIFARPTASPGLFTQMAGRGMRVVFADGYPLDTPAQRLQAIAAGPKPDCLVLDFAGNIAKHGTLDRIRGVFRRKHKEDTDGFKECNTCGTLSPLGTKVCPTCQSEFPAGGGVSALEREQKLFTRQTAAKISTGLDELVWADVVPQSGLYRVWSKAGSTPSLRLDYKVVIDGQAEAVSEFLHFSADPDSWACKRARREWRYRANTTPPLTTDEAVARITEMRLPLRLRLQKNARGYWDITGTRFF